MKFGSSSKLEQITIPLKDNLIPYCGIQRCEQLKRIDLVRELAGCWNSNGNRHESEIKVCTTLSGLRGSDERP